MNCRRFRKALTAAPSSRVPELERHRRECSECRLFSESYRIAIDGLEQRPSTGHRPDAAFSARVLASLPERTSPLAWATVRLLPVTTALALALLGWCWLATPAPDELWAEASEDELLEWVLSGNGDSL